MLLFSRRLKEVLKPGRTSSSTAWNSPNVVRSLFVVDYQVQLLFERYYIFSKDLHFKTCIHAYMSLWDTNNHNVNYDFFSQLLTNWSDDIRRTIKTNQMCTSWNCLPHNSSWLFSSGGPVNKCLLCCIAGIWKPILVMKYHA